MMLPLAAYQSSDEPLLLGPDGEVSAGAFFAAVERLAHALPDAPFVINLSESRAGFMLGFAAALVRRQTSLLPSGQGRNDWEQLTQQYPRATLISDRAIEAENVFDLAPYLAIADVPRHAVPIPDVPAEFTAAILFTSGSTGQPTAHAKSWGQLWRGASNLAAMLPWISPAGHAVVGSVPPQHMFGLESTVMLPWYAGIPVHAHKPLLPADIEIAIAQCARRVWWMTTPVHLRSPLQAMITLPALAGIVASTMSLAQALAAAAETRWEAPAMEIYGSTETGALAMRRTATEDWWTPLPDVVLQQQTEGEVTRICATGSHIHPPVLLADELQLREDGRFRWLGRSADMQKVGGKRASLAALNQHLTEIPGVDDAAYFAPDAADDMTSNDNVQPVQRLAAFYVSATLSPAQVRAALRARVDPIFVPRPLYRVPHLPRNANGKLTQSVLTTLYLRLKMAAATASAGCDPDVRQLTVSANHPALPGHFPGNPIVPGVVILSYVVDAIRDQLPHVVLETLLNMRFQAPLRPDQPFVIRTELRGQRVLVEVREAGAHGASNHLIASGQWACRETSRADDRA